MTTENAAVLFTDIVGSTELAQSMSPEVAAEVRHRHFSVLHQTIIEVGGTKVRDLGDGLMVVFPSSSTAMACAVAMQQAVERDIRDQGHTVGLRVGLSAGEVVREGNDYFGGPVIEAARLCAACESGQILAVDIVRLTVSQSGRHECRSIGEINLKGIPDPVAIVEVLWSP